MAVASSASAASSSSSSAAASDASDASDAAATAASDAAAASAASDAAASDAASFAATAATAAAVWEQVRNDCRAIETDPALTAAPLCQGVGNPFQSQWTETRDPWQAPNSPYAFWLRWYQAALDGTPHNPDLLRDIALIPDEEWGKGEVHIAKLIEVIEERYRLLDQIADLKRQFRFVDPTSTFAPASELHRSHNYPPELVDAQAEIRQQTTIIWAALDGAEVELKKPEPDPTILKSAAKALWNATKKLIGYFASLVDTSLKAAAAVAGTGLGIWLINPEHLAQVQRLAESLKQCASEIGQSSPTPPIP